jgi:hypothetical protein
MGLERSRVGHVQQCLELEFWLGSCRQSIEGWEKRRDTVKGVGG